VRDNRIPRAVRLLAIACAVLVLTSCAERSTPPREAGVTPQTSRPATATPPAETTCTPTRPNGHTPPGESPSPTFYGNGKLFTTLWPDGTVVFELGGPGEMRPDGSLSMKWPFWRGKGASGRLNIGGRSLHRPGLRVTADIPDGYGSSGFQATGLIFPEQGCYEVTATAGSATLSFVTKVEKR
jgi:hypothetical protein